MVFLRAKGLPRGALVEYQVCLHTGRGRQGGETDDDDHTRDADDDASEDDDDITLEPRYSSMLDPSRSIGWEECVASGRRAEGSRAMIFVYRESSSPFDSSNLRNPTDQSFLQELQIPQSSKTRPFYRSQPSSQVVSV